MKILVNLGVSIAFGVTLAKVLVAKLVSFYIQGQPMSVWHQGVARRY